jgi:hypothetical protein
MANVWNGRIIRLDTQNDDGTYVSANDAKNGGTKYSTQKYKISKIAIVDAVNTDDIVLKQCSADSLTGSDIINVNLETGNLNKQIDFPGGLWVKGICPATLDNSAKVDIYLC